MNKPEDRPFDLSEKGRSDDGETASLDRRLFMQFLSFGGLDFALESRLTRDLETFSATAVLYSDINDYGGAGLLTVSENPDFSLRNSGGFSQTPPLPYSNLSQSTQCSEEPIRSVMKKI